MFDVSDGNAHGIESEVRAGLFGERKSGTRQSSRVEPGDVTPDGFPAFSRKMLCTESTIDINSSPHAEGIQMLLIMFRICRCSRFREPGNLLNKGPS
jgi:hypothetical protein